MAEIIIHLLKNATRKETYGQLAWFAVLAVFFFAVEANFLAGITRKSAPAPKENWLKQ